MSTKGVARRLVGSIALGSLIVICAIVLASKLGAHNVDLSRALDRSLVPNPDAVLLFDARLPRILLGAIVGAALGAVGAALQALLRNPLADPYVLGTSGGAALGGTLVIVLGVPASIAAFAVPAASFAGALGATALVWVAARAAGDASMASVLLAGIVVNAFAAAAITLLKILVTASQAQAVLFWLVGSVGYESWSTIGGLAVAVALGLVALTALSGRMNLLSLGDEAAAHLGVDVGRVKWLIFGVAALMVGFVVSICGLVGFVGLVVPHGVRLALGPDHRIVVPTSAFAGAAFLVLADLGSRLAFDYLGTEPPVGAITALVGCPLFLWLLVRRRA